MAALSERIHTGPVPDAFSDRPTKPALIVAMSNRPTMESPLDEIRLVLLVSGSAHAWAELGEALAPEAQVVATERMSAIHDALRSRTAPLPVIVDCRTGLGDTVLSHIVPELPPNSRVVLWGCRDRVASLLAHVDGDFEGWTHCGDRAGAMDVAEVVRSQWPPAADG